MGGKSRKTGSVSKKLIDQIKGGKCGDNTKKKSGGGLDLEPKKQ